MKEIAVLDTGGFQMRQHYVERIPIPYNVNFINKNFNELVDKILSKKSNSEDTTIEENQIDLMVYKLYELTYDEVLVVDEQPPYSREEYEGFAWPEK